MFKKLSVLIAVISIAFIINACKENTTSTLPIENKQFEFLQNVEVGKQPAEIYFDEQKNLFHIFCLGVDLNFNDIKDAGDENPSWWVINKNDLSQAEKVADFDFGSIGFPFRPYIDFQKRYILISQNDKIKKYNLDNYSLISDNIANYKASGIYEKNSILFLSISTGYTTPGYVIAYDENTNKVLDSITAGINVQQILSYQINGASKIAILSEGTGNSDSQLQLVEFNNGKFNILKKYNGMSNNANDMAISGNILALVFNGSHNLFLIDLNNYGVLQDLDIQTSGYNGPRNVIFDGDYIYVTTYNSDVRKFNYRTGEFLKTFNVDSKAEGISIIPNELMLVCNISKADYSANNIISIFKTEVK